MQKITPFVWFETGAKEAAQFYVEVFGGDAAIKTESIMHDTPSGTVEIITVSLAGQDFTLMSAGPFRKINEAISFVINCETQEEVDHFWSKLSAVPEAEQCGWLKDKYGVSWQVVPTAMGGFLNGADKSGAARATQAMLQMKKLDIAVIKRAYEGSSSH